MRKTRPKAHPRRAQALGVGLVAIVTALLLSGGFRTLFTARDAFAAPATITGKADIVITNKAEAYNGAVAQCRATIHLPDGTTQTAAGRCISGDHYAVPYDGTYDYVGTLQTDGTYSIVIHSHVCAGANAGVFAPGEMWGTQQMGDIHITYRPKTRVTFIKTSANLKITQGNPSYTLEGASYDIFLASSDANVASITTDARGHADLTLEADTSYYAVETQAPKGFVRTEGRIPFTTSDTDGTVELSDTAGTVTLNLVKADAATGSNAQVGTSLEGAEFSITSSTPNWHRTATTDAHGRLSMKDVPLGDIVITETKPPKGYLPNPTPYKHTVKAGQLTSGGTFELEARVPDNPIAFDIEIVKYLDSGAEQSGLQQPGAGITFEIISNSTHAVVGSITTNARGRASTQDATCVNTEAVSASTTYDTSKPWMGAGKRTEAIHGALPYDAAGYTVREVPSTVPEGYRPCKDWVISPEQMADGACHDFIVDNDFVSSRIQVVKVDAATGLTIPRSGFSFQLLDNSKTPITQEVWHPNHAVLTTFTTDDSGTVTFPQALKPGTYYVREVQSEPPYLASNEDVKVTISDSEVPEPVTVVRIANKAARGVAHIHKACSETTCTQPQGLAGAEFDVVAQDDVVSADGTVQAIAGEVMDHITTGEDGWASTKELPLGDGAATYAFVETVPPAGHALDATPHPFTLSYADEATELVTVEVETQNNPTEMSLIKTDARTGEPLEGATFALWREDSQISVGADEAGALAIRATPDSRVIAQRQVPFATLTHTAPDDIDVTLTSSKGDEHLLDSEALELEPGTYTVGLARGGAAVACPNATIELQANARHHLNVRDSLFGVRTSCEVTGSSCPPIDLVYNESDDAHIARGLAAGTWEIFVDDASLGRIELDDGSHFYTVTDGKLLEQPILLAQGAPLDEYTTDSSGMFNVKHLEAGTYCLREARAPKGYLVNRSVSAFTVDDRGLIDGAGAHTFTLPNEYTSIDIHKRDAGSEQPVSGAELRLVDAKDRVVTAWTSTAEPYHIDHLEPGTYTLEETRAPQDHDTAQRLEITVKPTPELQTFAMYDEPISVTGNVDKRQQIADPTAPNTEPDGDGANRAEVTVSPEGRYLYSIDARNTSTTWVDEFTITDDLQAARDGLAVLEGVTTPQAWGDYDGTLNVWYTTNVSEQSEGEVGNDANATLHDGHVNPWLHDKATSSSLGEDGRALSYDGWRLWQAGLPADESTRLAVSDLNLADGEHVTAVRFEFGCVQSDFTTRADEWDRDDLKSPHDDLEASTTFPATNGDAEAATDGATGATPEKDRPGRGAKHDAKRDAKTDAGDLAPALIHMRVTESYVEGTSLTNTARVDLYRNGGSSTLEDHDTDEVAQTPRTQAPQPERLAQTGKTPLGPIFALTACALAAAASFFGPHGPRARFMAPRKMP